MDYRVYRLGFQSAVHFGRNSLEDSEYVFCADTLFSALCFEALRMGQEAMDCFYRYAKSGELLLSDAFPYIGDTYFLPKPMKRIQKGDSQGDSVLKKAYKKLNYIPADRFETYLRGDYDVLNERNIQNLGYSEMKTSAAVRGEEQTRPYRVGCYYYNEGNGLYLIAGYQNAAAIELLDRLMESLSYSRIGGKRSAGLGRFQLSFGTLPPALHERLGKKGETYMTLSVSLPTDDELESALEGAEYLLIKRSGFVASEEYAKEQRRRRDLYVLKAGACIRRPYQGDVYDVADPDGGHPVYRYARPMFMEVDV